MIPLGFVTLCALTLVSLDNGYGDATMKPEYNVSEAVRFFVASTITYVIVLYVAKLSVALVLLRIAVTSKGVRIVLICSIVALTIWTTVTTFIVAFQCTPLSLAWGEGTGTCLPAAVLANTGYSISAMDIASSFLYAGLPAYLLKGVQLSTRVKASIIVLLGLGVASSVVTIIRLKYLVDVGNLKSPTGVEAANAYLTTFVYSITEVGLTLFTGSLAALRPLLKFVPFGQTTGKAYGTYAASTKQSKVRDEMGNNMKLQDFNDGESQDFIVPKGRVHKTVQYEVKYSNV
ncbi:putative integral membrane protein [Rosellinia necatrix]|uniref:Putative integral membrane protein n=1 Tax=Rosellinia necatrix TaxID=77044 RepID=A0A1W2TR89_ROSNE|nr:putative integral membrane protein [Rosellinia necatrix]